MTTEWIDLKLERPTNFPVWLCNKDLGGGATIQFHPTDDYMYYTHWYPVEKLPPMPEPEPDRKAYNDFWKASKPNDPNDDPYWRCWTSALEYARKAK